VLGVEVTSIGLDCSRRGVLETARQLYRSVHQPISVRLRRRSYDAPDVTGELTNAGEVLAAVALAVQVGAIALVAGVVGWQRLRDDKPLAALLTLVVALAQVIGVALVLSMLGILSLAGALVAHVALAAVVWWRHRDAARDAPATGPAAHEGGFRPWPAVAAAVVIMFVLVGADLSFGVPSKDNDTREYHVTNMAHWLEEGSLWDLPYQSPGGVTATHPGNGELLGTWLSLPSGGDELAYAMPLAFAVLAIAGGAVLTRGLAPAGAPGAAAIGAIAGVTVLTAPLYLASQLGSLSTDVVAAATLLATVALLAAARDRPDPPPLVLAAGACLGLAVGAKYTALVPGAAITLAALLLLPRRRLWWWLVPGVALFGLPWYLRNAIATGNPLFPLELGPLPGGDTPLDVIGTPMGEHLLAGRTEILGRWYDHGARLVGPVALLAAAGCLLTLRRGPSSRVGRAVAVIAAAAFAGYLAIPYGGGGPEGLDFLIASGDRYALAALLFGVALLAAALHPRHAGPVLAAVMAWNLWNVGDEMERTRPDLGWSARTLALAAAAAAVLVAVAWWRRDSITSRRLPVSPAVLAAVAVGAVTLVGAAAAFHRLDRGTTPSPLEAALLELGPDEPVVPLGVGDHRSLLGPRLERRLVAVIDVDEPPFVDRADVRQALLGDADPRPAASSAALADDLDQALAGAPADVVVVGPASVAAYPSGWAPDERWCALEVVDEVVVYVRVGTPLGQRCGARG
jgi:hypothetical protein